MKNIFMPYYINGNNIKSLFQIAINRYGNIDVNVATINTTLEVNVPLSEITCGKISQGSAKISYFKSNTQSNIDFDTKASIDAFINLENILNKNNAIKNLTTSDSINQLLVGDIVEITSVISQIDPILNFYRKTLNLLQFQEITDNVDNSKIINWINKNIETIINNKKLKFSASPNFTTDSDIILTLDTNNSILDVDYYLDRPVTIFGQVTKNYKNQTSINKSNSPISSNLASNQLNEIPIKKRPFNKDFSQNTIFGSSLKDCPLTNHGDTFNLNAHLLWDYLNSSEKYSGFLEHLVYPSDMKNNKNTIEIMPFMIYL